MPLRDTLKRGGGHGLGLLPQCRFERCIFLIGHMRCGSTALANVLCAHPEISGFGEAHVAYDHPGAPGRLAIAQIRHRRWKPGAAHLFDKILHNALDADPPADFFRARAIFVTRPPEATIPSIVRLFGPFPSRRYATPAAAAAYYAGRLERMATLWASFPAGSRIALDYPALVADPGAELARLSDFLALEPALANRYGRNHLARRHGVGDPLSAHRFTGIMPGGVPAEPAPEAAPAADAPAAYQAWARFRASIFLGGEDRP